MRIERLRQDACTHYLRHDACTPSIHLCRIIVYIIQGIVIKIIKCVTISPKRWRKASSWFKRRNAWKNTVNKCNDTFIIRLLYHDKEAGITSIFVSERSAMLQYTSLLPFLLSDCKYSANTNTSFDGVFCILNSAIFNKNLWILQFSPEFCLKLQNTTLELQSPNSIHPSRQCI